MRGHVVICGLGHIGFRAFELLDAVGLKVAVITDKTQDDWRERVEARGGLVKIGDATSDALLRSVFVESAFAVLAVTDRDLVNVSVVMDARRLNPQARIVCRLFDTNLGLHISEAFGVSQVFSTSELAAPVFVDAITHESPASRESEPRVVFASSGEGAKPVASLVADAKLDVPNEKDPTLSIRTFSVKSGTGEAPPLERLLNFVRAPNLTKFRRTAAFILLTIVVSAGIIKNGLGLSWLDAIYFVTATVTTVGYGDINLMNAAPWLKAFGIALMLVGATSLAVLISAVAEMFLSRRLTHLLGGRPVPRRGHVIVIGARNIGLRVIELLRLDGIPVVIVENDKADGFPVDVRRNVSVVEGDPRAADTLQLANVEGAIAIVAVSDDDVENLSVTLSAQRLNPKIQAIARVFDAELSEKLQKKLKLHRILSVSGQAAPYFVAALFADEIKAATRWENHLVFLASKVSERVQAIPCGTDQIGAIKLNLFT